ncbi:MAG: peptidase [Bacteroidetes bacterium]|nr:MAG: peptidase [Bacteroidota bacterium]
MKKSFSIVMFSVILIVLISFTWISDLYMPVNIKKAYEKETRSFDGKPGSNYWQNSADYNIQLDFEPQTRIISGSEKITYYNNSPGKLTEIVFHLFPNLYKKGNIRDFEIELADESEGVMITEMAVNGKKINVSSNDNSLEYEHTSLKLYLQEPLPSGGELNINISWYYQLNENSHMRTGVVDSSSFFMAYFFPRIAVYDDIDGWNDFKYMGDTEFYNDFGNFDVSITVPQNFIIWATGILQNPEQVLTKKYLKRYQKAFTSNEIISIIDSTECTKNNITKQNTKNTWKFKASNVTDFAFASSDHYLWDATSLIVDKETGRRVLIDAAYNKHSKDFYQVVDIARQATELMSYQIPGIPFPFPQITVFNGLDAMEYPMMVNNISENDINETIKVTTHEILHSYLPFYMGINETKYAWMDEGFTSFAEHLILCQLISPEKAGFYFLEDYKKHAGYDIDAPIFTNSEYLKRPTYTYNSYPKPAGFFLTLKDVLGDDKFKEVLHEFMHRWNGKHPTPYDFFFTLNNTSGQNLDWLIKPWFYEFGYVDIAIKQVSQNKGKYKIIIEKKGHYPAAVHLKTIFVDGSVETITENASVWKNGNLDYFIEKNSLKKIKSVELLDPSLLDADMSNNIIKY